VIGKGLNTFGIEYIYPQREKHIIIYLEKQKIYLDEKSDERVNNFHMDILLFITIHDPINTTI